MYVDTIGRDRSHAARMLVPRTGKHLRDREYSARLLRRRRLSQKANEFQG